MAGAVPPPIPPIPPAPIQVTAPNVNGDADRWLNILSNCEAVAATPFLDWQPGAAVGGAAHVSITTHVGIAVFARRCSFSTTAADLTHWRQTLNGIFDLALTGAKWTDIISELRDSGLFVKGPFATFRDFRDALLELTILNPAQLVITAADHSPGEAWAIPALPIRTRPQTVEPQIN